MLLLEQANVTSRVELWAYLGWEPQGNGGRAVPRRMGMLLKTKPWVSTVAKVTVPF